MVAIALLLLFAGIATATYIGVRAWVRAGPQGVQFRNDYRLARVFAPAPAGSVGWSGFALAPGGRDMYAIRSLYRRPKPGERGFPFPELVRIHDVDRRSRVTATPVLSFRALAQPRWRMWPFAGPLSVAPNGDVFLAALGEDVPHDPTGHREGATGLFVLFVLHPDGSWQRVLSSGEVARARLFPSDFTNWTIAASAPNRVWVWVDPWEGNGPQRLLEVIDPNNDGDWSDRIVRRIALPSTMPFARRATKPFTWTPDWSWQLAAEPPLPHDARSHSVLAAVRSRFGEFRVYRISDRNDDGDALDPGEVRLLFKRDDTAGSPSISPRIVLRKGIARRELVVAGLSQADRVSIVSASGEVHDVARAFAGGNAWPQPLAALAGRSGAIYAATDVFRPAGIAWVVYRLTPASTSSGARAGVGGSPVTAKPSPPLEFPKPAPNGAPILTFERVRGDRSRSFTIAADGSALRTFVPGADVRGVCESGDGHSVIYASDDAVPTEFSTYVAGDGAGPKTVLENADVSACPFSPRWLLVQRQNPDGSLRLIRYDTKSSSERVLADDLFSPVLSRDGTRLVAIGGLHLRRYDLLGHPTLVAFDLSSLGRHRLAGPLTRAGFGPPTWSPDGSRIAYYTSPTATGNGAISWTRPNKFVLWVRDVTSGRVLWRRSISGGPPSFAWSPDSSQLLVCLEDRGFQSSCPSGPGSAETVLGVPGRGSAKLLLFDLRTRVIRLVARGRLLFAGWAPTGGSIAYATHHALFVKETDGRRRLLIAIPRANGPWRAWLGWSPDGSRIGLETRESGIYVVDVRTRALRVLRPFGDAQYRNVQWWR
jgi:hypothetical protein